MRGLAPSGVVEPGTCWGTKIHNFIREDRENDLGKSENPVNLYETE